MCLTYRQFNAGIEIKSDQEGRGIHARNKIADEHVPRTDKCEEQHGSRTYLPRRDALFLLKRDFLTHIDLLLKWNLYELAAGSHDDDVIAFGDLHDNPSVPHTWLPPLLRSLKILL